MTFDVKTLANLGDSLNKYVVSPINAFGVGGFVFDIEGETSVNLTAEITDHYTESNFSIQDHIAVKPKKLTLKNYVGEVSYIQDENTNTIPQKLTQKITAISEFLPELAKAEEQFYSILADLQLGDIKNTVSDITNNSANLWGFVQNTMPTETRQTQAYAFFKALYEKKILVSVQTPFEFMSQMAIESIIATQPEESKSISNFTIVLKEIRFASTLVEVAAQISSSAIPYGAAVPLIPVERIPLPQGRTALQAQSVYNIGITPGLDPADILKDPRNILDPVVQEWMNRPITTPVGL